MGSERRTDEVIAELVRSGAPVRQLPALRIRITKWAVLVCVIVATATAAGRFGDHPEHTTPLFLAELGLLTLVALSAGAAALKLAIPGEQPSRFGVAAIITTAALVLLFLSRLYKEGVISSFALHWEECAILVSGFGMLLALPLVWSISLGAPVMLFRTGTYAGLAAGACGAMVLHVLCDEFSALHLILFHIVPACAVLWIVQRAARRFLTW